MVIVSSVHEALSGVGEIASLHTVLFATQFLETQFLKTLLSRPDLLMGLLVSMQVVLLYLCGVGGARLLRNRHRQVSQLWLTIVCFGLLLVPFHLLFGGWSLVVASPASDNGSPSSTVRLAENLEPQRADTASLATERSDDGQLAGTGDPHERFDLQEHAKDWDRGGISRSAMPEELAMEEPTQPRDQATSSDSVASLRQTRIDTHATAYTWGNVMLRAAAGLYVGVVVWLLFSNLRGALWLRSLRQKGQPTDGIGMETLEAAAQQMRLRKLPEIIVCEGLPVPLTCGIHRPLVLVPEGFLGWEREEQRMVLLHEFAHIQRNDLAGELLARGLTILFWFHPASWFIVRQQRAARELAADELVVASGADKYRYANCLISVIERMSQLPRGTQSPPVVAMSTHRNIETRISALVAGYRVPARSVKLLWSVVAVIVLSLLGSSFRLRSANSAQAQESNQQSDSDGKDAPLLTKEPTGVLRYNPDRLQSSVSLIERVAGCLVTPVITDDHGPIFSIGGVVKNPDGAPAVGATVILRESPQRRVSSEPKLLEVSDRHLMAVPDVFAKTQTDEQGRYEFNEVRSPELPTNRFRDSWEWNVIAVSDDGFGSLQLDPSRQPIKLISGADIALEETRSIQATVVNADGDSVPNAIVQLYGLSRPGQANRSGELQTWMSVFTPLAQADANGQVAFSGLPVGHAAMLAAAHVDFVAGSGMVATSDDVPLGQVAGNRLPNEPRFVTQASPARIEMEVGHRLRGRVLAGGLPVAEVRVGLRSSVPIAQTDKEGRFELRYSSMQTRGGPVQIVLNPPENSNLLYGYHSIDADDVEAAGVDAAELGDIELQQGVRIVGNVLCDGNPVPDVWVAPTQSAEAFVPRGVSSTKEGTFELVLPPKATTVFLTTDIPGFKLASAADGRAVRNDTIPEGWPQRVVTISEADVGRTIELEPFHIEATDSITIQAVLPDGKPASLANVTVKDKSQRNPDFPDETIGGPVSLDESGRTELKLAGMPSSDAYAEVRLSTPDGGFAGRKLLRHMGVDHGLTMELQPGMLIRGTVSLNNKPLRGARVTISKSEPINERGGFRTTPLATVETDENGQYSAGVERVARYSLFLQSVPGQPDGPNHGHSASPSASGVVEVDRFDLRTGSEEIHGVALNVNRQPLEGVSISVNPKFERNERPIVMGWQSNSQLTTDKQGRFFLRNLPPGEYQIRASSRQNGARGVTAEVTAATGDKAVKIFIDTNEAPPLPRLNAQSISDY